jgi:shikimate dehydrogenase
MFESVNPSPAIASLEAEQREHREYVIFGAPQAQARILTCFNTYFEEMNAHALCLPSLIPHKLTVSAIAATLMRPQTKGVAFARPQSVSECPDLAELNDDAAATQVVSAIRKLTDGRLGGALFDGVGLVTHLKQQNLSFKAHRVLVLGAGHQSCAVALAAVRHGASHLDLLDPRQYLAQSLMNHLNGLSSTSLSTEPRLSHYDIVINTWESNAMVPQAMLINCLKKISPNGWAIDTSLSIESSTFLKIAHSLGIHTFSGIPSLRNQVRYYLDFFDELRSSKSSIIPSNLSICTNSRSDQQCDLEKVNNN